MYILTQKQDLIINSDCCRHFEIQNAAIGGYWIVACGSMQHYGNVKDSMWLGRYMSKKEATDVLLSLLSALEEREISFKMPLSEAIAPESMVHDARTKRRGGS